MRPTQLRPPTPHPSNTPVPHNQQMVNTVDGPHEFCLGVEFRPGMSLGSVETVRVELSPVEPVDTVLDLGRPMLVEPLPVRLVVPGALVMPSEHGIDASPFGGTEVVFYVTPLVAGPLPQARVEMLHGNHVEAIDMPVRGQGRTLPVFLALLMLLAPLLLHLATCWPEALTDGRIERQLLAWLPGVPSREVIAHRGQDVATFIATTGAAGHFSFYAFVGLLAATVCVVLLRRPSRVMLWSAQFSLVPPKGTGPPSYLTPVSAPELGAVPGPSP